MTPIEELELTLKAACSTPGRKVMTCAPDVVETLRDLTIPEEMPDFNRVFDPLPSALAFLTGVDVVEDNTMPIGHWEIVRHDRCHVNQSTSEVTHGNCLRYAEGALA